ncbi:MAG TPA: hypothetical protein VIL36_12320 [Acidimicrobiales bacterium]
MEPVGGPVIGEDTSRRSLVRVLLAVMGVAVLVGGVMLLRDDGGGGDDDVAADRVGEVLSEDRADDDTDDAGTEVLNESPEGATASTAPPATAPAGPTDLLRSDATPAFGAFAGIYDGAPVKVVEIALYTDYAFIDVQVPNEPTHVDEYQWRGGDGVSGPEPQSLLDMEVEELPEKIFDLSEIDPAKLPSMTEQALAQFPQEGMEVTHVLIDRFLPFDTRVIVRVYVDNERGEGGYVQFTPDGGFVETVS